MCPTVVIAARQHLEAEALCASLAAQYTTEAVAEPEALYAAAAKADAVVIDADFSDCQGIDVLMDLASRIPVPVVMITPPDDPLCAIEALRAGAATYLVKSSDYLRSVPSAVLDAIRRVNEVSSLRDQIVALRQRIKDLEHSESGDDSAAESAVMPPPNCAAARLSCPRTREWR
jgi:DNA-binding NarL/FixJ family response regulator